MALTHQEKIQAQQTIVEMKEVLTNPAHIALLESIEAQFDFTTGEVWAYNFVLREMKADMEKNGRIFRTGKKWVEVLGLGESEVKRLTPALTRLCKEGMVEKQKGEGKGAAMEYAPMA